MEGEIVVVVAVVVGVVVVVVVIHLSPPPSPSSSSTQAFLTSSTSGAIYVDGRVAYQAGKVVVPVGALIEQVCNHYGSR